MPLGDSERNVNRLNLLKRDLKNERYLIAVTGCKEQRILILESKGTQIDLQRRNKNCWGDFRETRWTFAVRDANFHPVYLIRWISLWLLWRLSLKFLNKFFSIWIYWTDWISHVRFEDCFSCNESLPMTNQSLHINLSHLMVGHYARQLKF